MRSFENNGQPLYRQIAAQLWESIQSGQLQPGAQMPSETVLCEDFGVNRLTVRQAIAELQRQGAVTIRRGVGTFVASPPDLIEIVAAIPRTEQNSDVTHDALSEDGGLNDLTTPSTLRVVDEPILSSGTANGPSAEAAAAHLGVPAASLWRLDTVMIRSGENWIANTYWFDRAHVDVVEHARRMGLVVAAFREGLGLDLQYDWRAFSATGADFDDASLLGVAPGSALLVRDGVTSTVAGIPLFYVQRRMRGDTAKFVLRYGTSDQ